MMEKAKSIRLLMLHTATVLSAVILAAGVLDWFNPYMNFSGQIRPLEALQVIVLAGLVMTVRRPAGSGKSREPGTARRPGRTERRKR